MRAWVVGGLIVAAFAAPLRAAEGTDEAEIARWIAQLQAPRFAEREAATTALLRIGPAALPALERTAAARNNELTARTQHLIRVLKQRDLEARLAAFLVDREPARDHGLVGWERFRALCGSSGEARQVFGEIQRCQADLLAALALAPKPAGEALRARALLLQQGQQFGQPLQLGDVAGLLFAALSHDLPIADDTAQLLFGFCHQPAVTAALQGEARREVLRALLGAWVARGGSDNLLEQSLQLAIQHDLPQGVTPATRVLEQAYGGAAPAAPQPPPKFPPHIRQYALVILGKHGTAAHLRLLEPALEDTTVCMQLQQGNVRYVTQARDIALSALLDVTKQDRTQYGLPERSKLPNYHFNPVAMGFKSESERDAALARWRQWRAGH